MSSSSRDRYSPHAIVISPLELTIPSGTFTYSNHGFLKDGYNFDPNFDKFLLSISSQTKSRNEKLRADHSQIQSQPLAYWKAQCAFRALSQMGTTEDLQQRLRSANARLDLNLAHSRKILREEFWRKNAAARKKIWDRLQTDERKACANPRRFLTEKFPISSPLSDVVTLKLLKHDRKAVYETARALSLVISSTYAPPPLYGTPSTDKWIVIGRDPSTVREEIDRVRDKAKISQLKREKFAEGFQKMLQELRLQDARVDLTLTSGVNAEISQCAVLKTLSRGARAQARERLHDSTVQRTTTLPKTGVNSATSACTANGQIQRLSGEARLRKGYRTQA